MKKILTFSIITLIILSAFKIYNELKPVEYGSEEWLREKLPDDVTDASVEKYLKFFNKKKNGKTPTDKPDEAVRYEIMMTKDPATNDVPKERLLKAYEYAEQLRQSTDAPLTINWQERGPKNVGGRTRAILIDANDPSGKTVFSAGVGGGLWKTTDITALEPNWTQVNDFFANIAICAIAQNPLNVQEIYFGTGEGFHNVDAIRGLGIWKSTDGGGSFNQLPATNNNPDFYRIQKLVIHPTNGFIFAATRDNGVMRSTNGGVNWSKVLGAGMGGLVDKAADLEIGADGAVYATLGMVFVPSDGIYKTTNFGANWTKLNTGLNGFPTTNINRIEIACAPNNANVLYAVTQDATTYAAEGIYKTTDGGTTFTPVPMPVDSDPLVSPTFTRTQAWYDLLLGVDPNNANVVYVGGIDLFKSINGGLSWTQISHWYGLVHQDVHADQHVIVFQSGSSDVIYFGNDGGIYRTTDGSAVVPTIKSKEINYNTTQFYGCAIHPEANKIHFLTGSQDNGSHKFTSAGINNVPEVTGGDGANCHIDKNQPQYQWTAYVYNSYFRSTDGGESFTAVDINGDGQFINPTDYDDANNKMYCGNAAGTFLRWENPQSGSTNSVVTVSSFSGGSVTAVRVGNTNNRVFFGLSNAKVIRVDNAHSGTSNAGTDISAGLPGAGTVSCIEVENGNDDHILVTYSNYGVNSVWESTTGGASWTSVEGNLPDMPIWWGVFSPLNNDQAVLATELGVWTTDNLNGGSTNWGASNSGLANVSVHQLQYRTSDNFMIAATHGRGLFSTDAFSPASANFSSSQQVSFIGKNIQFTDASTQATSWLWNFGDGATSTLQNPSHAYLNSGTYTVSLTINGSITQTKTNYISVVPERGTPYDSTSGGNFEVNATDFTSHTINGTKWERGNSSVVGKDGTTTPSNAWVTGLTEANYLDYTTTMLYTPDFNFTNPGTYTFSFWSKFSTEATWDGFRVEYSTNKGDTWLPLGTFNPVNWYNTPNNVLETVFPVNEPYFSGVQSTYKRYFTDASSLAGNSSVVFRFVFKSDTNTPDIGVAIDDFRLQGPPNVAMPVELESFSALVDRRNVNLFWRTASELNNSGFDIERSLVKEGEREWIKAGFVTGNGTTNEPVDYQFTDANLSTGHYSYRLKQTDFNGNFEYHSLSGDVSVGLPDRYSISQNYPNPFNPSTKINFDLPFDSKVTMKIFDITGREISTVVNDVQPAGYYTVTFDGKTFASGIYFYRIVAEGNNQKFIETKKMVLIK